MKTTLRIMLIGTALLVVGCSGARKQQGQVNRGLMNQELVKSLFNMQVENAIVTQHTLFPYHFTDNSAELNELGERDFDVLVRHLAENPGRLNIKQGNISDELYEGRVQSVLEKLQDEGVDPEKTAIVDDLAGGKGITSLRAIDIVQDTSDTGSSTSTSSTSITTGL